MLRRTLHPVVLVLVALVLAPATGAAQAPRPLDVAVEVLAVVGDPAPGAGGATYERFPTPPLVDAGGRVVFEADLAGDTSATGERAIFRAEPGGEVEIALRTTDVPTGAVAGVFMTELSLQGFADGRILAKAQLAGPGVVATRNDALVLMPWSGSPGFIAQAVVPGFPAQTFLSEISEVRLARNGKVVFHGLLGGAGVNLLQRHAVLASRGTGSGVELRARVNLPLAGDPGIGALESFWMLQMNGVGEVAFGGSTLLSQQRTYGVFGPDATVPLRRLVAEGDPVPGTSPPRGFESFEYSTSERLDLTDSGDLFFFASCDDGEGSGIWEHRLDGALVPRATTCPPSAPLPDGRRMFRVSERFRANDAGTVAFEADTRGGPSLATETLLRAHADGRVEVLIDVGQPIPGRPGDTCSESLLIDLNEQGDVLAEASLVGNLPRTPIVLVPAQAPPAVMLARHDLIEVGSELREVLAIGFAPGPSDARHEGWRALGEEGTVAVQAYLDDRWAIVRAHYPITRDSDGDGAPDWQDTCLDLVDPGQEDADGNGVGDACNDGEDTDGDEFADALDTCPDTANPGQEDLDGDSLGDACDPFPDEADHEKAMLRADLSRTFEELLVCLDRPLFVDTDGDGEDDTTDACPDTPAGAEVDMGGCSQDQFCRSRSGARLGWGLLVCSLADWRNDELHVFPSDCRPGGRRWRASACVADEPDYSTE
jgi:hypothetical protein